MRLRQGTPYNRYCEMLKLPQRGKPLLDAINQGFSVKLLQKVASNLTVNTYKAGAYIDIKTATLNRRLSEGTLTPAESDRLYRLIEVYDAALDLFNGDKTMACHWLHSPAAGLSGELPLNLIRTSTGTNDVLALISKIESGVLI